MVEMLLYTQYYFSNKYKLLYKKILQLEEEKFIFFCAFVRCQAKIIWRKIFLLTINNLFKTYFVKTCDDFYMQAGETILQEKYSLLDASFHMSVNQNDNHYGGPISLGFFMKAVEADLF